MPTIPAPVLNEGFPSRSGMPRGVQQVPDVPHAPGSLASSQLLGTAVAGLGTAVLTANELAMQRAAIEERKAKADAVIAGNLTGLQALPALQTLWDTESQDPDYSTFGARFLEKGRTLIQEQGQGLTPQAKQAYELRMADRLVVMHQQALGDVTKRRDEAAAYVAEATIADAQKRMIEAKTQLEFDEARGTMVTTLKGMVDTGLARGGPVQERIRKTDEIVPIEQTKRANIVNPAGMVTHLKALAAGKKGTPGLPVPPGHLVSELLTDAIQQRTRAQAETHRGDLQADKDVAKAQSQAETGLANELAVIMQTDRPDPVALQAVQRKIMAAGTVAPGAASGTEGLISGEGHTRLMALSRSLLTATTSPREAKENQQVRYMLEAGISDPQAGIPWPTVVEITTAVTRGDIHGDTGARLIAERTKQVDAAHPSKIDEVTKGREALRIGIMASLGEDDLPMEMMGRMGLAGGPQRQRYLEALTLYDKGILWMQSKATTPKDKIAIAREFSGPLAAEITRNYSLYFREHAKEELPILSNGLEPLFAKEGITATWQQLHTLKDTMSAEEYDALRRNLEQRQALKWTEGDRSFSPAPAAKQPEVGIWDRIKEWANSYMEIQMPAAPKPQ